MCDLKELKQLVLDNQQALIDAMSRDFGHRSTGQLQEAIDYVNERPRPLALYF